MALMTAIRRLLFQVTLQRGSWLRTAGNTGASGSGCLLSLNRGFSTTRTQHQSFFFSTQRQRAFTSTSTQPHRGFSTARSQPHRGFSTGTQPLRSDNKVTVHFVNRDGEKITVKGSPGDSLLDVVIEQDLDFDGFGACGGVLACSTCHLIFDEEVCKQLGPVTDEEMDMLDVAYGLTDTSRLGCQICLTKSLEGMVARVPQSVADIRQRGDVSS